MHSSFTVRLFHQCKCWLSLIFVVHSVLPSFVTALCAFHHFYDSVSPQTCDVIYRRHKQLDLLSCSCLGVFLVSSYSWFIVFYVSAPYCSLYKLYINHNQTLKTLTFWSLSETFVRSCSILFLVLATTVVMWHGKKSVILSLQRRYSALFAGQIWRSLAWHCPVIGFHHSTTSHVCITDKPYFFITHNWFSRVHHMASIERPDVCLYICVCTAYMCK